MTMTTVSGEVRDVRVAREQTGVWLNVEHDGGHMLCVRFPTTAAAKVLLHKALAALEGPSTPEHTREGTMRYVAESNEWVR